MIVKFFKRAEKANTKNGESVRNYLLNKERLENGTARLLSGDPNLTTAIINSQNFASNYTSGVLSFDEQESKRIKEIHKQQIMQSFEECLLPNFEKDRYSVYWVEHNDKGRLELNFVIAKVDLKSGKFLNVYNHASDMKRVDCWKNIINHEYSLTDPNDPIRKRNIAPTFNDKRIKNKDLKQKINDFVSYHVENGNIKNHDDVVNTLTQALSKVGLKIDNIKNKSISIKNPNENGKNIRLTGAFFEKNFVASERTQERLEAQQQAYNAKAHERYLLTCQEYENRKHKRQEFLFERYQTEPPTPPKRYNFDDYDYEYQSIEPICNDKFNCEDLTYDFDNEIYFGDRPHYEIDPQTHKRVIFYADTSPTQEHARSYDRQEIEQLARAIVVRTQERIIEATTPTPVRVAFARTNSERQRTHANFAELAQATKPSPRDDRENQRQRNELIANIRAIANAELEEIETIDNAITANTKTINDNTADITNNSREIKDLERERLAQQQIERQQQQELERQQQAQSQAPRPKFSP